MFAIQAIIAASGCLPAYLVGKRMFNDRAGLLFSLAYAIYPEMIFVHSRATPEFLYIVICLWLLYIYLRLQQSDVWTSGCLRDAWVMGTLTGIGLLVREGVLIVAGAAGLALLIQKRPIGAVIRRIVVPVTLACATILVPWTIRNWVVQGHFIPLRSAYGLNLWMGNHAEATGTDKTMDGGYQMSRLWEKNKDYYARVIPQDEYGRNQFYRAEALRYIRTHPVHYLELTAKRLWYYLWFDPTHPLAKNLIYRVSYIFLLIIAIPGVILAVRRRELDLTFLIMFGGFLLLYVPVIVLPRYRIIPVLMLLIMASYFVANLPWAQRWLPDRATEAK
jgi:4-amino-4-deoxy-L-arabinose transferase-like glycosyltransferase